MIINAIRDGNIANALYILISVLLSLTVHEFCHGWVAQKCGDNTARNFGRLTLNPLKHLDVLGTVSMLIAGFGWAKPVPVNFRNLKKPRRDIAFVSLAGPASNFILAFFGTLFYSIFQTLTRVRLEALLSDMYMGESDFLLTMLSNLSIFFLFFSVLNIGLGLFNLIPIPPLDGSKILGSLLPPKYGYKFIQLERYAGIFMLILFICSSFDSMSFIFEPLSKLRGAIFDIFVKLFSLLPFID